MRVSVNKNDSGYVEDFMFYDAYLNGVKVDYCMTADEELGYVWVYKTDADGKLIRDANGDTEFVLHAGVVQIKRQTTTDPIAYARMKCMAYQAALKEAVPDSVERSALILKHFERLGL